MAMATGMPPPMKQQEEDLEHGCVVLLQRSAIVDSGRSSTL